MDDTDVQERSAPSAAVDDANPWQQLLPWVCDRLAEGHCVSQIFNTLRDSGWERQDAVRALLHSVPESQRPDVELLQRRAPEPDFSRAGSSITLDGHTVQVLCDMHNPRLVVFGHLLSPQECEALIASASTRLERSTVTGDGTESTQSDVRTSSGMFFERGETQLLARIEARISALIDWPARCLESMQVLRYGKDQRYEPHHDFFEPEEGPWAPVFRRGGQRVASLVIYLNSPALGGSTVFPDIPLEVRAVSGNAVFFAYATPDASSRTLHGGAPVQEGDKWVAVLWFRQVSHD